MKHKKQVKVPARTVIKVTQVVCDLCGDEIQAKVGDAEEVFVKHRTGHIGVDGGAGEEVSVDLCGQCFDRKLVPWLKEYGASPVTEEWDW